MSAIKTKFAGRSPFVPKPVRTRTPLDLAGVQKCRDPYKPERVVKKQKYDQLFAGVQEGDCFRVAGGSAELSALARALRLYLKRAGIDGVVRQQGRTEDGIGRVWLVKVVDRK